MDHHGVLLGWIVFGFGKHDLYTAYLLDESWRLS